MDHPFRGTVFGGFKRQDVINYLETITREATKTQQELRARVAELEGALASREEELARRQERLDQLERDHQALQSKAEETGKALTASEAECTRVTEALGETGRELAAWKARAEALAPVAAAYEGLKDRTAGVELDAHRRAQAIQDQAEEEARQLHGQMANWLRQVEREYETLRSQVESTVSHAASQLGRAGETLDRVNALVGEQNVELSALVRDYSQQEK